MAAPGSTGHNDPPNLGVGQVVLRPAARLDASQVKSLYRLSDPALSELDLEDLLTELLERVRDSLDVDTVAILLFDQETQELVARAAKGIEEEVEQGVRIPIGRGFAGRIAAERLPIFIADVDHADILNPILREKGIQSLLGVPLIVEGYLIGVLHIGSLTPRIFHETDVSLLEMAAARAAPAIDRARLFSALEREHRVATLLQRSLLPRQMPAVVGIEVAARYMPARDEVGGDWYDVIELPRGLLGVVIGDVVGHGISAAALMGQLRTALRSYAIQGHGPGRTLELVDRYIQSSTEGAMATAAYAILDTADGGVRYASAGHLPPIINGAAGARLVEVEPAPPLGAVPFSNCPEHLLRLESDEMIVLYTDGLVERPGVPLDDSINSLVEVVAASNSVDDACVLAIDRMAPIEGPRDDIAIVAMKNARIPERLRLRLPARPAVLSEMRQALRRWLSERGASAEELAEITIAVSEACANAVEHAYSPRPETFELEAFDSGGGQVTIIVRDSGKWREPRGQNRGRGLGIIAAAMHEVDVNRGERGTEVLMRRRLGGS